jgi:hypothetical protein
MSPTIESHNDDRFEEGIRLANTTYVGPKKNPLFDIISLQLFLTH